MEPTKRILDMTRRLGVLRARDLAAHGIARTYLQRLRDRGVLIQVGRGLYLLADAEPSAQNALAVVARRVPAGVICLLSALQLHGLTTQAPFEVWVAVPTRARIPKVADLPVRFVRMAPAALEAGVVHKKIDGVQVPVFDLEKTVVDCFRHRTRIGLDVALEAMREYLRRPRRNVGKLLEYGAIDRVRASMRPYLEALV